MGDLTKIFPSGLVRRSVDAVGDTDGFIVLASKGRTATQRSLMSDEQYVISANEFARKAAEFVDPVDFVSSDTPNLITVGSDGKLFVEDAPSDGQIYGRKDGAWEVVPTGLEITKYISDATSDLEPDVAQAWNDYADRNAVTRNSNEIIFFEWPSGSNDYQYSGDQTAPPWTTGLNDWTQLGSGATPGGGQGAVQYNYGGLFAGNETKFFWDPTAEFLGIGTAAQVGTERLNVSGNAYVASRFAASNDRFVVDVSGTTPILRMKDGALVTVVEIDAIVTNKGSIHAGSDYEFTIGQLNISSPSAGAISLRNNAFAGQSGKFMINQDAGGNTEVLAHSSGQLLLSHGGTVVANITTDKLFNIGNTALIKMPNVADDGSVGPTALNGGFYYNTTSHHFRGYSDGAWTDIAFISDIPAPTPPTTPAGDPGQIQFNNAGAFGADAALFWDNTNKRLGLGTATPAFPLDILKAQEHHIKLKHNINTNDAARQLIRMHSDRDDAFSGIGTFRGADSVRMGVAIQVMNVADTRVWSAFFHGTGEYTQGTSTIGNFHTIQPPKVTGNTRGYQVSDGGSYRAILGIDDAGNGALAIRNTTGTTVFDFTGSNGRLVIGGEITNQASGNHMRTNQIYLKGDQDTVRWANSSGTEIVVAGPKASNVWQLFDVAGATTVWQVQTVAGGGGAQLTGTMTAANFQLSSDPRKKTFKDQIGKGIVPMYSFEMKDKPGQIRFGVNAEELKAAMPDLVDTNEEGFLQVSYIDYLVAEVARLSNEVNALKHG